MISEFISKAIRARIEAIFASYSPSLKESEENKEQFLSRFTAWESNHVEYINGVVAGVLQVRAEDDKIAVKVSIVIANRFIYDLMLGKA